MRVSAQRSGFARLGSSRASPRFAPPGDLGATRDPGDAVAAAAARDVAAAWQ
jgi:hypothetical protein